MKVLLFVWLLLAGSLAMAQPGSVKKKTSAPAKAPGLAQITLLDQTILPGRIIRRDSQKIYYTKPNDPTKRTYQQLLSRLDRITYADGRVETFRKPLMSNLSPDRRDSLAKASSPSPAIAETAPAATSSIAPPVTADAYVVTPAPANAVNTPKNSQGYGRVHLTVGPELAYFPASINKQWSDVTVGVGINQNIGGSLRFDYRFMRSVAVSLTAGYSNWQLVRNYLKKGIEQYDETIQQTRIPLQAGLKLYPTTNFYILPEGGVNLLTTSVKTSASHPAPDSEQSKSMPITYGVGIGYEIQAGNLLIDLSGHYQLLSVKNLNFGTIAPALSEQVQFASVRLGIGFNGLRK